MTEDTPPNQLQVARRHLERVLDAWHEPTDWDDLSLYGFYCLEAAVMAAADSLGWGTRHQHPEKAEAARRLHEEFGLPDIDEILIKLNQARKATAYGDVEAPEMDAEEVASAMELFVDAVARFIEAQ